jgi:hypothetical protein
LILWRKLCYREEDEKLGVARGSHAAWCHFPQHCLPLQRKMRGENGGGGGDDGAQKYQLLQHL